MLWGAAPRQICVVAYNVHWDLAGVDRVAGAIRPLAPDVVLLEEVPGKDVEVLAREIGMTVDGTPNFFYSPRPQVGPIEGTSGTAILSRHPLEHAQVLPGPGWENEKSWGFGAWAETIVDGRRFAIACVHLTPTKQASLADIRQTDAQRGKEIQTVIDLWRQQGSPPLIFGGDFNQVPLGPNYRALASQWTDALATLGKTEQTCDIGWLRSRVDYFWLTPEWQPLSGEVVNTDASDHRPIRLDVRARSQEHS